jgi:rhodanese-related sulfurtransferase
MGQPTPAKKWTIMEADKGPLLENREVQIHPGELIQVAANRELKLILLDVRNERDYNLFHLVDSRRVPMDLIARGGLTKEFLDEPANAVVVVVSNDEAAATEAWKDLVAEGIMNVYILEGGINGWLDLFAVDGACQGCRPRDPASVQPGELSWTFDAALGSNRPIADPDLFMDKSFEFEPKVKLEVKKRPAGGCG